MEEGKKGKETAIIALIFLIAAIVTFFIKTKTYITIILTLLAFILSIVNSKNKNTLNTVVLGLSIVALCVESILMVIAYQSVKETNDNTQKIISNAKIGLIESKISEYVVMQNMTQQIDFTGKSNVIININEVENISSYTKGCIGYGIFNISDSKTKAYLKCDDGYITEGFDSNYLK